MAFAFLAAGVLHAQFAPPASSAGAPSFEETAVNEQDVTTGTVTAPAEVTTGTSFVNYNALLGSLPIGKTLVLPVAVNGAGPIVFTATSNNASLVPIVKSGYPLLNIHVTYAGDPSYTGTNPSSAVAFSGTMSFALLRDMAPKACAYIAGLAESGSYNGLQFFRVADLNGSGGFIAQAGDPAETGTGSFNGFTFDNELNASLIFSGSGQLALANAGTNQSTFAGTNDSQFFVTQGPVRGLDFQYTIFGQLVSGFDVMNRVMAVPRKSGTDNAVTTGTGAEPTVPVIMDSVTVSEDNTDAILFVSAAGPGSGKVFVHAKDPSGQIVVVNSTTLSGSSIVSSTTGFLTIGDFNPSSDKNAGINDPPFFPAQPANAEAPLHQTVSLPIRAEDLEFDYLLPNAANLSGGFLSVGVSGAIASVRQAISSFPTASANVGLYAQQTLVPINNSTPIAETHAQVTLGDGKLTALPLLVPAMAGQTLSATGTLGLFVDSSPQLTGSSFAAIVNYGDGSPLVPSNASITVTSTTSSTTGTNNTVTGGTASTTYNADGLTFSHALHGGPTTWALDVTAVASTVVTSTASTTGTSGTTTTVTTTPETTGTTPHSYPANGIYPLTVTLTDTNGGVLQMLNPAVVSDGPMYAEGYTFTAPKGLANAMVADFYDSTASATGTDYTATIVWGDGNVSTGLVRGAGGHYSVYGRHQYTAGTSYPVDVSIQSALLSGTNIATAWSIARPTGVPAHQPPFAQVHINGQVGNVGFASARSLDVDITLVNSGNLRSGPIALSFYLSTSQTLGQGTITPLTVANQPSYSAAALAPGQATHGTVSNIFIPAGVTTTGKFLVVVFTYADVLHGYMDSPDYAIDPTPLF